MPAGAANPPHTLRAALWVNTSGAMAWRRNHSTEMLCLLVPFTGLSPSEAPARRWWPHGCSAGGQVQPDGVAPPRK